MSQENVYQQVQGREPQKSELQQTGFQQREPYYPHHGHNPGHPQHMTYHHHHHHYHYHYPMHHYQGR
ncbi:hypothetical protein D3C72_2580080 [compost metagenome]